VRKIGAQLNARMVLEGSVRKEASIADQRRSSSRWQAGTPLVAMYRTRSNRSVRRSGGDAGRFVTTPERELVGAHGAPAYKSLDGTKRISRAGFIEINDEPGFRQKQ